MGDRLQWGIIGAGNIARTLAEAVNASATGDLLAIGSRSREKAEAFGDAYGAPRRYDSYDALIADPDIDAVYNALPNSMHLEWTVKCAAAGKHILCEKPLTANAAEAEEMMAAVRQHDVFLLEAFMYRCHPQTARLVELIRSGAIGAVRVIQVHFSYNLGRNLENIRLRNDVAGGAIMDVGCYCMSMARLVAGAALDQDRPAEPEALGGVGHIGAQSRVDEYATAVVKFPGEIVANLTTGSQVAVDPTLRIWGSDGHILIPNPWFPGTTPDAAAIHLHRAGQDAEIIPVPGAAGLYTTEVDTVAAYLDARQAPAPCMTWDDSIGNMRALDRWRAAIGLVFDSDRQRA